MVKSIKNNRRRTRKYRTRKYRIKYRIVNIKSRTEWVQTIASLALKTILVE